MTEPRRGSRCFTLVELMIAVAIVSILAAIAVPAVSQYQVKARYAEAQVDLDALFDLGLGYEAAIDTLPTGGGWQPGFPPIKQARAWNDGSIPPEYAALGFAPGGNVYACYRWFLGAGTWSVRAYTDLDGDANYRYTNRSWNPMTKTRTDSDICSPGPSPCY